jgi:hypothetical protein
MASTLTFAAALAAALGAGEMLTMNSSISTLTTPWATATISFADIPDPQEDDRLAVACVSARYEITTVYWQRVTAPVVAGSEEVQLFAGANAAGCPNLVVGYFQEIDLIAVTEPITTAPMVQQVRLSLTNDPTTAVVDWVSTLPPGTTGLVTFGESADGLNSSALAVESANVANVGKVCYALLAGLRADTRYFYSVFDGTAQTEVASFVHRPAVSPQKPQRIAIFADFGVLYSERHLRKRSISRASPGVRAAALALAAPHEPALTSRSCPHYALLFPPGRGRFRPRADRGRCGFRGLRPCPACRRLRL